MASGALSHSWDKLLLVVALAILALAIWQGLGYQEVEDPEGQLEKLKDDKRDLDRNFVFPPAPELEGWTQLEAGLTAGAEGTPAPIWTFYDYPGFALVFKDKVADRKYRLPEMTIKVLDDPGTQSGGDVQISWQPDKAHSRKYSDKYPPEGKFRLQLKRHDAALGPDTAEAIFHSDRSFRRSADTPQRDGLAKGDLKPGHTYVYQVEVTFASKNVLEADGTPRIQRTLTGLGTASLPWRIIRYDSRTARQDSSRQGSACQVTRNDGLDHPGVSVKRKSMQASVAPPLAVPKSYRDEVGASVYPFRLQAGGMSRGKPMVYRDLQSGFFNLLFPSRTLSDAQVVVVDPGSGSGGPGGGVEQPDNEKPVEKPPKDGSGGDGDGAKPEKDPGADGDQPKKNDEPSEDPDDPFGFD